MKFVRMHLESMLQLESKHSAKRCLATTLPDQEALVRIKYDMKLGMTVNTFPKLRSFGKTALENMRGLEASDRRLSDMKPRENMVDDYKVSVLKHLRESMLRAFAQKRDGRWCHSHNGSLVFVLLIL
jgi:hypothetical protein